MQDYIPNRNYLAAQNKNLIRAGDRLVTLTNVLLLKCGKDIDLANAIRDWNQAKENLMGLVGR